MKDLQRDEGGKEPNGCIYGGRIGEGRENVVCGGKGRRNECKCGQGKRKEGERWKVEEREGGRVRLWSQRERREGEEVSVECGSKKRGKDVCGAKERGSEGKNIKV